MTEDRKRLEVQHSDQRRSIVKGYEYRTDTGTGVEGIIADKQAYHKHFSNMKFYSISESSFAYRDALLLDGIRGAVALDYCCGNGEVAIELAKHGASRVVGIDLSPVAVENARELARVAGVDAVCEFLVMDAEHTEFADGTFDVIHEYGALHHLDLPAAFKELARILKPEGKVVCTEALRHNPLIHWYRRRTPYLRTKWEVEHILGVPEIESGSRYFASLDFRTFHLAALFAVPFRKTSLFKPILGVLELFDRALLTIPLLKWLAWVAVIEYRKPIKA